jgi:hypothetical protein
MLARSLLRSLILAAICALATLAGAGVADGVRVVLFLATIFCTVSFRQACVTKYGRYS